MRSFVLLLAGIYLALPVIAQQDHSDCNQAYLVCREKTITITELNGSGMISPEIGPSNCYDQNFPEAHSAWLKWKIKSGGTLEFSIIPIDQEDDLDFVLYKLFKGVSICEAREEIRCMASGKNMGEAGREPLNNCLGITGLSRLAHEQNEWPGCASFDDNFLSQVQVSPGESFALFVNNFGSSKGFILEFTGTAELEDLGEDCSGDATTSTTENPGGLSISDIFPNPADKELTLTIQSPHPIEGFVQIFNVQGNILYSDKIGIAAGEQAINFNIDYLTPGSYYLRIRSGEESYLTSFNKY